MQPFCAPPSVMRALLSTRRFLLLLTLATACSKPPRVASRDSAKAPVAKRLVAGHLATCLRGPSGDVRCWGLTADRDAPSKPPIDSDLAKPRALIVPPSVAEVALGYRGACVRTSSGDVHCLVEESTGTKERSFAFQQIPLPRPAVQVDINLENACAALNDGSATCWAYAFGKKASPRRIAGLEHVTQVAVGLVHACARREDGTVACWGQNQAGQLGDGSTVDSPVPRTVVGLVSVTRIASKNLHSCALTADGAVYCWGLGDDGQLGDGVQRAVDGFSSRPVRVPKLIADDIVCGGAHTCASSDGRVFCWGHNSVGALGIGKVGWPGTDEPVVRATPQGVLALDDVVELAAGGGHQCALRSNGEVWCWGNSFFGQVGRSVEKVEPAPVRIDVDR